ncbi:hypothetical protein HA402_000076 [Bradysia odoriphaga]|nr:hypothetical protein HA402_000076 [Bradysia odoriphaga]
MRLFILMSQRESMSFTTMPPGVLANSRHVSEEDIQIALAPYIQTYLSQTGRRHSCCSVMLPVAFERAASKSWLDPCFDSAVLEGQYQASVFPQIRLRFRFALLYILLCSLVWMIYFLTESGPDHHRYPIAGSIGLLTVLTGVLLWLTYSTFYRAHPTAVSACTAVALCVTSLCFLTLTSDAFSPLGHFAICVEIVLLIYTVIPLHLWQNIGIAATYSIAFEILTHLLGNNYYFSTKPVGFCYKILVVRILLQVSVHLVGVHVLVMNVVRMRGTFMKVGQNLLVRRQLEMEKQLKEKMIHSVMPPKVADMLLKEVGLDPDSRMAHAHRERRYRTSNDVKSLFRPFHMHSMDNVSILFADIVGFTKMSSTKTAEQLVEILNDLFERFDDLCTTSGCEKISTLGDCYYCVSGCPEPRPDHAICCVEMGLDMIAAMRAFDAQRHEGVKMRVGVHTGTVLCGIVGTRRVKFDVWSNDVTLANRMESTGKPEQVHISEQTCSFLGDNYLLDEGEDVEGHRTYFVVGRRKDCQNSPNTYSDRNFHLSAPPAYNGYINGVQLSQSATNISAIHPSVPPASPVGVGQTSASLNPSPILSIRPRLASFNRVTKYLISSGNGNVKEKTSTDYPKIVISSRSLPDSLNSDHEDDGCCRGVGSKCDQGETQPQKYSSKFKHWKVPKFLRKMDGTTMTEVLKKPDLIVKKSDDIPCVEQNGYQALPIVIESPCPTLNTLDVPHRITHCPLSTSRSPDGCSPAAHSMFDDIIDVRSYISQSRSDISPFGRSASYRSQCGRSPQSDVSPMVRPRALTVVDTLHEGTSKKRHSISPWGGDGLSLCPSATSRKDSGIRSNSRRSSIQQQIYAMNQGAISTQRVSGYFTSSQSSLSDLPEPITTPPEPNPDPLGACLQQLRKQSDLQLIRCVRDNAKSQRSYLVKPPLTSVSLFFKSRQMEREFRSNAHRFGCEVQHEGPPTFATPKYNTYIDIFVGIIVYFAISASLFLLSITDFNTPFRIWVSVFAAFSAIQFFAMFLFTKQICRLNSPKQNSCEDTLFEACSNWYPWHICLGVLMMLPIVLIIVNFSLQDFSNLAAFEYHYGFLIFVCIIHFCNFTQLNCWMRNTLAILAAISFVGIALGQLGAITTFKRINETISFNSSQFMQPNTTNLMNVLVTNLLDSNMSGEMVVIDDDAFNTTMKPSVGNSRTNKLNWFNEYHVEIYLDLLLVLILVWFLNREFEIGYRLTFYGSAVANQDKIRVQNMKNQADMLLHNIIPKHVAEQLKNTAKYSENHQNVAIIFASIVNFNELYDESYLGGKEYLRVLNELIGDFDELLSRHEFRCVEKIKTIGSSFMAASGLDPSSRSDNNDHIIALMNFSLAMQQVINAFNKDLLEFNLILRIGFNVGDVTAGVIGTSKLHYDIWGDSVNVASRMDSTGVAGKIQVGKFCLPFLESRFEFEARGSVYVKGKDNMEVFLVNGLRSDFDKLDNLDPNADTLMI